MTMSQRRSDNRAGRGQKRCLDHKIGSVFCGGLQEQRRLGLSRRPGTRLGGLLIGARCKQLGVDNVRLIDKAADVGGTWYWNRYPGIACDVESYVYMPLLEELGYVPTEKYAKGAEILAHCRRVAERYDLY